MWCTWSEPGKGLLVFRMPPSCRCRCRYDVCSNQLSSPLLFTFCACTDVLPIESPQMSRLGLAFYNSMSVPFDAAASLMLSPNASLGDLRPPPRPLKARPQGGSCSRASRRSDLAAGHAVGDSLRAGRTQPAAGGRVGHVAAGMRRRVCAWHVGVGDDGGVALHDYCVVLFCMAMMSVLGLQEAEGLSVPQTWCSPAPHDVAAVQYQNEGGNVEQRCRQPT